MDIDQIRLIEELAANAWRPRVEQHLGGWRLRFTGGHSRRVNSVFPNFHPAALPIEDCLSLVEDFYRRRGVPPRYQLCPAALPADLPDILGVRGYTYTAHTAMKIQTIPHLLEITRPYTGSMETGQKVTDRWFETYASAFGYSAKSLPIRRSILSRIGPEAHFVLLSRDGELAATGLGVVERGWLGVFCVVTKPKLRRMGLASAVMHALAEWGQTQYAEQIYLQVMEDNPAGLSLYSKLGFKTLYQYFYAEKLRSDHEID
jgi:GNAT superfamily N-acetyltransferase